MRLPMFILSHFGRGLIKLSTIRYDALGSFNIAPSNFEAIEVAEKESSPKLKFNYHPSPPISDITADIIINLYQVVFTTPPSIGRLIVRLANNRNCSILIPFPISVRIQVRTRHAGSRFFIYYNKHRSITNVP